MISGFDAKWLGALGKYIEDLERRTLEGLPPAEFDLADILHGQTFLKVRGLADFWSASPGVDFFQHITDLAIGAHNQRKTYLTFILAGTPEKLSVYISYGQPTMCRTLLEGIFPGIQIESTPVSNLEQTLRTHFLTKGLLTGIPSYKSTTNSSSVQSKQFSSGDQGVLNNQTGKGKENAHLERLVRGMRRATWGYIVQAYPRPRSTVVEERLEVIDHLADISSQARLQRQSTKQDSTMLTAVNTGSHTETLSGELINYRAQYLVRLLERNLERLDQAVAAGQWLVNTYFGARTADDAHRLISLLMGTLSGKESRPDPLRAHLCSKVGNLLDNYHTFLSSDEVAALIQFPREEVPGYALSDYVQFDVDFCPPARATLTVGTIQQYNHDIHDAYAISLDDLTKHAVVVGVTGSGKTTTVMNLLHRMSDAGKPFLVIEPAKTEYRVLRNTLAKRVDVHVYTLGNEMVAPFRLNPFEFETDDSPGNASVVNHIDFLKAVFNAAFILYAPMPYVLETALHEIYTDKGWDLATGLNSRLPKWTDRHLYPIFPTLSDLYRKIDRVVERLGYDVRIEQDVKAGLKARIGSMRLGSKGQMFDTARGISMEQLLSTPTILEMENIGGDDEKTFLMGILLTKLYEYRRLQAIEGKPFHGLQHLLVFEEAHRLLKNTDTQVQVEGSNLRAQAIEVFTNMLSEIRGYGQGVLVAEQIPSKLAPDVMKNTNLKIAHRLIARDDRESVGQTMNLSTEQMAHLSILTPGMAAIFAEGDDHAFLVRMENVKEKVTPLTDSSLKSASPAYASVERYLAITDLKPYSVRRTPFGGPDTTIYQAAGQLLDSSNGQWLWASILIRTMLNRSQLPLMMDIMRQQIVTEFPHFQQLQQEALLVMTIIRGVAETLQERGATFGWSYPMVEDMRIPLSRGLLTLLQTKNLTSANADLDQFSRKYEARLTRDQGPFPGCISCPARCVYRADVRYLLQPVERDWIEDKISATFSSEADRYTAIARTAKGIAKRWLGDENAFLPQVGYCGALHIINQGYSQYIQEQFADLLAPYMT